MLGAYASKDPARFHMPGHKGRGMGGYWRGDLVRWDVTELADTDNLHAPSQSILRAQQYMAEAYGARASFFVVNGGSAAVQAMLLSLAPGERLLLSRDAHRCAVSGVSLRGLHVDYILPEYDETAALWGMVTPEALDRRLCETGATAVLITSPNYYGFCADIAGLSRVAHAHGALLLVDAAHGAHFPFSELLPTPLAGYADMWAHSQHKTMDALTQAASLHLGDCRVAPETVQRMLALIETSSPSYLLMSSLDWSVYMARRQDWSGQVRRMDALRTRLSAIPGVTLLPGHIGAGVLERDRTRLVLDVTQRGLTGFAAEQLLNRMGVYCEMADLERLVLITSPEDDPAWYTRLTNALIALPMGKPLTRARTAPPEWEKPLFAVDMRAATFAAQESIALADAAERIAGEPVGVYPPGIALAMPGERFTPAILRHLIAQQAAGAHLFGVRDGNVWAVRE